MFKCRSDFVKFYAPLAHVLQHADRDDSIERLVHVSIVFQTKFESAIAGRVEARNAQKLQLLRLQIGAGCVLVLLLRDSDSDHVNVWRKRA